MSDTFPGVTVCDEVGAADWLRDALRPEDFDRSTIVAMLVPAAYPAHGRILHRASRGSAAMRWAEVAAMTGQPLHPEAQYCDLIGWESEPQYPPPPEPWGEPEQGRLLPEECAAVAEVLSGFTTTPGDCWFCVWEGYGSPELERLRARAGFTPAEGAPFEPVEEVLDPRTLDMTAMYPAVFPIPVPIAPQVHLQSRECILFRGSVTAATAFELWPTYYQSPTLWWPADRAWCVASELDIYSTYVAAEPAALRALIDHPVLEVVVCTPEHTIDRGPP